MLHVTADTMTSREYAVPDMAKSGILPSGNGPPPPYPGASGFPMREEDSPPPPPLPPHPRALYGGEDGTQGMQGFSGNSLYAVPTNMDLLWQEELTVMELPRENLKFMEKLGEGQFGEVSMWRWLGKSCNTHWWYVCVCTFK